MAIAQFENIATGVYSDPSPQVAPAEPGPDGKFVWTNIRNMRQIGGQMKKMGGSNTLIDCTSTVAPYYHVRIQDNNLGSHYVYCGLGKIYSFNGLTHFDISKAATTYASTIDYTWSHTLINTYPIFVNANDTPQVWTTVNDSTKLVDLTNWPAGYKCSVMRAYKKYLVAMNINTGTSQYSSRVKWSTYALTGALPSTWDITDPTNDAGEIDLADTPGAVIDCLPLGDFNVIYKQNSTYIMQYIGGVEVFGFKLAFPNIGMLAKNCACAFNSKHLVVTNDDIVIHDGFQYKSIVDNKNRKYFFQNINSSRASATFVAPNYSKGEIWICYPKGNSTWASEALVWDYNEDSWTIRTLPQTSFISCGQIDLSNLGVWSSYSNAWPTNTSQWSSSSFNKNLYQLSAVVPGDTKIYNTDLDDVVTEAGSYMTCTLEREILNLEPSEQIKVVSRIWPRIDLTNSADPQIQVYVGSRMKQGDTTTWNGPFNFNAQTADKLDAFTTGRYISVRFTTTTNNIWALNNFDLEYSVRGRW